MAGEVGISPRVRMWHSILPTLDDAPTTAFDLDRASRFLSVFKPVEMWDKVVLVAHEKGEDSPSSLLRGQRLSTPAAMYLFFDDASLSAVFGANPRQAAQAVGLELKPARLVSVLMQGFNEGVGGFFMYGARDASGVQTQQNRADSGSGVPEFLPREGLEALSETLSVILLLAKARTGQISQTEVLGALENRVFFYRGAWLSEGQALKTQDMGVEQVFDMYVSPSGLLKNGGGGLNIATITLGDALERLPEGARIRIEADSAYSYSLLSVR